MDALHVITVVTHDELYLKYLKESCIKHGLPLEILGWNKKWEGFNWKIFQVLNYLKNINPNDIVCYVDGYDVICTRKLEELKTQFIEFKKNNPQVKIIVGGNRLTRNILNISYYELYFESIDNCEINSGTYIGYATELYEVLTQIYTQDPVYDADDQVLFINYYKKLTSEKDMYIDVNSNFFCLITKPLQNIDKYITINTNKNDTYDIIYNNSKPFFIHGNANTFLDNVIKKLGYSYNIPIYKKHYTKIINKTMYFVKKIINSKTDSLINSKKFLILYCIILLLLYYKFNEMKKK